MAHSHVDRDGTRYERDRTGELVPVVPASEPVALPVWHLAPGQLCENHSEPYGYPADACPPCVADYLSGERPAAFIGRHYDPHE